MGGDYSKGCLEIGREWGRRAGAAVVGCVLLLAPMAAQADDTGLYFKVEGGRTWTQQAHWHLGGDVGDSAVWGAGLGYRLSDNFRADLSYASRSRLDFAGRDGSYAVTGDVSNKTVMLSFYWDVASFASFTPYVGGGVGWAVNSTETAYYVSPTSTGSRDGAVDHNFAWQAVTGGSYAVTSAISLDLSIRFIDAGRVHLDRNGQVLGVAGAFNNPVEGRLRMFEGLAALRYQF